jgi:phage shock protein C
MPRRHLYRSRVDRKIAGVCAGLAEYLDVDPTLVRILWVMLVMFGGCGVIGYLIGWMLMPQEPLAQACPGTESQTSPQNAD